MYHNNQDTKQQIQKGIALQRYVQIDKAKALQQIQRDDNRAPGQ